MYWCWDPPPPTTHSHHSLSVVSNKGKRPKKAEMMTKAFYHQIYLTEIDFSLCILQTRHIMWRRGSKAVSWHWTWKGRTLSKITKNINLVTNKGLLVGESPRCYQCKKYMDWDYMCDQICFLLTAWVKCNVCNRLLLWWGLFSPFWQPLLMLSGFKTKCDIKV